MARGARPILYGPRGGLGTVGWPGQPTNLVGFNNTPATQPTVWPGGTWPGAYPGALTPAHIGDGTGGTYLIVSGTPGNPTIISFKDFTPKAGQICNIISADGTSGISPVHDVTFVGCRFTGNSTSVSFTTAPDACLNCVSAGSTNITFSYCTVAPLVSLNPTPVPGTNWPSSSVGTGVLPSNPLVNTYTIPYANAFRDCINLAAPPGSTTAMDHCDLWGGGEIITVQSQGWTIANRPISLQCGQFNITDCWLHDCRNNAPAQWLVGTPYSTGAFVFQLGFVYMALSPTTGVDPSTDGGVHWLSNNTTNDHTNGIICPNGNSVANVLLQHCTVSAIGNTDNITFSHLQTVNTIWDASRNYSVGNQAGGTDGFYYSALIASGPGNGGAVNPNNNAHPTIWQQFGYCGYQNITVKNCWIDGFNDGIDLGIGNSGQTGMIFEDNIISNDVMWGTRLCQTGGGNGPYSPFMDATGQNGMFTAQPTNSWRRNTYNVYPLSASYDAANFGKNGQFLWPDGSLNTTDWPN